MFTNLIFYNFSMLAIYSNCSFFLIDTCTKITIDFFFYITIAVLRQNRNVNNLREWNSEAEFRSFDGFATDSELDAFVASKRDSSDVSQYSEVQFSQEWDFSDCVASTNENSLKVLSILDFAGQSAYYACHHIFFSPRAFYILVVDMSKDLKSRADRACDKEGLIYSDWTYAGIQIYTFN